jgi:hypothetical protein
MLPPKPDLTLGPPRSPRERLAGLVHVPRMLDKARACSAGRLGEYKYPCPLDRSVLEFLKLDAEAVLNAAACLDDDEMAAWIEAHAAPRTPEEREAFSAAFLARGPDDADSRRYFAEAVAALGEAGKGVTTWAGLLDADEGR